MKKLLLFFSIISLFILTSFNENNKNMIGSWKSEALESTNGLYGLREFIITKDIWEVKFTLFLDKDATNPIFTFRGIGKYKIENISKIVKGAKNAVFYFDNKYLTLKTDNQELIKNFGFSGLKVNQETNISENGMSFIESNKVCGQEYDLVSIIDNKLYLGERPQQGKNICAKTTLQYQ